MDVVVSSRFSDDRVKTFDYFFPEHCMGRTV